MLQCVEDYLAGKRYPLQLIHVDDSIQPAPSGERRHTSN